MNVLGFSRELHVKLQRYQVQCYLKMNLFQVIHLCFLSLFSTSDFELFLQSSRALSWKYVFFFNLQLFQQLLPAVPPL